MSNGRKIYSIDACWLINLEAHYPADIFPPVWDRLADLFDSQQAYVIDLVIEELEQKEDAVHQWMKSRGSAAIRRLGDSELKAVGEVMTDFPQWADIEATKTAADPFVVAEARCTQSVVVTHETLVPASSSKAKIPNACAKYGLQCIYTRLPGSAHSDFFREMGWKF